MIEPFSKGVVAHAGDIQRARAEKEEGRLRVSKADLRTPQRLGKTCAWAVRPSIVLGDGAAMETLERVRAEELEVLLALAHAAEFDAGERRNLRQRRLDRMASMIPEVAPKVPAITVSELKDRLAREPRPFLLDVREPWEYADAHVEAAQLIPLGELEQRLKEVPEDRPVLVICHSGQRSLAAAAYLLARGYREVANVDGGTAAWIEKGYPISR